MIVVDKLSTSWCITTTKPSCIDTVKTTVSKTLLSMATAVRPSEQSRTIVFIVALVQYDLNWMNLSTEGESASVATMLAVIRTAIDNTLVRMTSALCSLADVDWYALASPCRLLLRRPETNILCPSIVDNIDGGVHLVKAEILQRRTGAGGSSVTWPLSTAVRHQCCCSSKDWSAQMTTVCCYWKTYNLLVVCTWTN